MTAKFIKEKLDGGALTAYTDIYTDIEAQKDRYKDAVDNFVALYGDAEDIRVFSTPGRTEVAGNHTDHNRGVAIGASVECDIIAVVARNDNNEIRLTSCGYDENCVGTDEESIAAHEKSGHSNSLIAGVIDGLRKRGHNVGGFYAYTTSTVPTGSGLSSSAAFEVLVATIENHLYNDGTIPTKTLAEVAQYAEREFYGKPCGLLDQLSCATGGPVYLDFADPSNVTVEPLPFTLTDNGYVLCIVAAGGSHAALSDEYAAIPAEMKSVAKLLGREDLSGVKEGQIIRMLPAVRRACGDRAALRALHFVRECDRVKKIKQALIEGNDRRFLSLVRHSGDSSYKLLQNLYVSSRPEEQSLPIALALGEKFLAYAGGCARVHGGGFSGTIQAYVPKDKAEEYANLMDGAFGTGSAMIMKIRPRGTIEITL